MILKGFWFSIESTCSVLVCLWLNRVLYGSGVTNEGKTMRVTPFLGDISGETAPLSQLCSRTLGVAVLYTSFWMFLASTNLTTSRRGRFHPIFLTTPNVMRHTTCLTILSETSPFSGFVR